MRKLLLAFALALVPSLVLAQGALLQGGPWTPGHMPQYVGQGSGQAVVSDGGAASGGALGANVSEIGVVARGTGTAPYAGQGTGPYGTNICDYDAPSSNPAGYHYLCFSANAQGGALLAYGSAGAATPGNLQFIVNGAAYTFPFTGSGGGNVVGPGSSTANDIATFSNTIGTLLKDSGISLGSQSQNLVLATPSGSSGAPSFRALAFADLPITGTPSAGFVPIGAGSTAAWTNLFGAANSWSAVNTFAPGIILNPPASVITAPVVGAFAINSTNPVAVSGAPAELDHFRCSQANGGFNQYTMTGSQATVSCFEFQMQATSGSNSTSNMYGIIGAVNNLGAGTVAGLYGRGSAGSSSATGSVFAIKSGVNCGTSLANCYLQQANIDTVTFGGVATAFFWGASLQGTQGSGSAHYGILLDNSVSYDQAQFEGYAVGTGNFLQFLTATGSSSLMSVDQFGDVVVSNGIDSTSKTTGSIVSTGGMGLGKSVYIGGPTLSLGATSPYASAGFSAATLNGTSGSVISLQANGTETGRLQANVGTQFFLLAPAIPLIFGGTGGGTLEELYPSGGLFLGTSPSDPGANNFQAAGLVTAAGFVSSTAAKTLQLKQGANGSVGTFICTSGGTIAVGNTNVAISDAIIISLNTVGGSVTTTPSVKTITAGTGFSALCATSDTSTYNYALIKNAA